MSALNSVIFTILFIYLFIFFLRGFQGILPFYNRNLKLNVLVLEFPFFTFVDVLICASFYRIFVQTYYHYNIKYYFLLCFQEISAHNCIYMMLIRTMTTPCWKYWPTKTRSRLLEYSGEIHENTYLKNIVHAVLFKYIKG